MWKPHQIQCGTGLHLSWVLTLIASTSFFDLIWFRGRRSLHFTHCTRCGKATVSLFCPPPHTHKHTVLDYMALYRNLNFISFPGIYFWCACVVPCLWCAAVCTSAETEMLLTPLREKTATSRKKKKKKQHRTARTQSIWTFVSAAPVSLKLSFAGHVILQERGEKKGEGDRKKQH